MTQSATKLYLHYTGCTRNFSILDTFFEDMRKFRLGFTMVVFEKIFGNINK